MDIPLPGEHAVVPTPLASVHSINVNETPVARSTGKSMRNEAGKWYGKIARSPESDGVAGVGGRRDASL